MEGRAREAGETHARAQEEFRRAASLYALYSELVVIAAGVDAANLDAARSARDAGRHSFSCDTVSTRSNRRQLGRDGIDLVGKDIDQIVPRSLGGADHPANYCPLASSVNRSLGNEWNLAKCTICGVSKCATASDVRT